MCVERSHIHITPLTITMKSGYKHNRQVETGNYVGLKFDDGWMFLNVLEVERIDLKPYVLYNEDNEREEIAPRTAGTTDDEIIDELGRQLVEPNDSAKELMFQVLVGVAPSRMQVYPMYGRNRAPNLRGGAEPGDPQVPLTGYDSPYNNPSLQGEFFTTNDMNTLQLQAYNPMDEPKEARLSMYVNKFRYTVVENVDLMRSFIDGQVPFRSHPMGLGAKNTDQLSTPGWIESRFGDVILTTREIYQQTTDEDNGVVDTNGNEIVEDGVDDMINGGE